MGSGPEQPPQASTTTHSPDPMTCARIKEKSLCPEFVLTLSAFQERLAADGTLATGRWFLIDRLIDILQPKEDPLKNMDMRLKTAVSFKSQALEQGQCNEGKCFF